MEASWRDIPIEICPWKTAYNRFNRLSKKGLWEQFSLTYEHVFMKNGYSQMEATYFIADKAYGSEAIRVKLKQDSISPVIPKRKNTKQPDLAFDYYLYKLRHLVENTFARLKHYRSIAICYKKLARNYKYILYLACTMIHCKLNQEYALNYQTIKNPHEQIAVRVFIYYAYDQLSLIVKVS